MTFQDRVRNFAAVLNPLFDPSPHMQVDRLFEFVCALIRPRGVQGPGWDSWYESQSMMNDLYNLAKIDLPTDAFPKPDRTRTRLALIAYCHLTEMDVPYDLVANLLRIRLGMRYDIDPFRDLMQPAKKGLAHRIRPHPSPKKKIKKLTEMSDQAKLPEIGKAFEAVYDSAIRNAVYHSDYVLGPSDLHLLSDFRYSAVQKHLSQLVPYEELNDFLLNATALYAALFMLYERCRKSFADSFRETLVPYDLGYKGLLELLFDSESRLSGFRVFWPNKTIGEFHSTKDGCSGVNYLFDPGGRVSFMVGLFASKRSPFSPLVEEGSAPGYAVVPGTEFEPYWPDPLAAYKVPEREPSENP